MIKKLAFFYQVPITARERSITDVSRPKHFVGLFIIKVHLKELKFTHAAKKLFSKFLVSDKTILSWKMSLFKIYLY